MGAVSIHNGGGLRRALKLEFTFPVRQRGNIEEDPTAKCYTFTEQNVSISLSLSYSLSLSFQ